MILNNGLTIFKLSPSQVEILLAKQFGARLQPLDIKKLNRERLMPQPGPSKHPIITQSHTSQEIICAVDI
jgi:hypothetical protein